MFDEVKRPGVARRGDELRVHILYAAKDVFLEMGFERASMDTIAERAKTSKRTLYAHYESKEKLYLAVIEYVRATFLARMKTPGDYADDPEEAVVQFCARFLNVLTFAPVIRMCRMSIAEVDRFPAASSRYFETLFSEVQTVLAAYLKQTLRLSPKASANAAQSLIAKLAYPTFVRALFGLETLADELGDQLPPGFDIKPVRKLVAEVISRNQNIG